jgi:hypothetical protein
MNSIEVMREGGGAMDSGSGDMVGWGWVNALEENSLLGSGDLER